MRFDRVIRDLKVEEGFRAAVYDDATGKRLRQGDVVRGRPTIGYGTTDLSELEAAWLLVSRVSRDWERLRREIPWIVRVPDEAKEVLLAMAYQLGIEGLLAFKRTLAAAEAGEWVAMAAHMRDSRWWRRQTPDRAERLAQRIEALVVPRGDEP